MITQVILNKGVRWIAPADASHQLGGARMENASFLLNFTVSSLPEAASPILLSAHSRYRLFVNGSLVEIGPCKGDMLQQYIDPIDILPYLRCGENQLLVQVRSYPLRECRRGGQKGPDWAVPRGCGPCMVLQGEICGITLSTGIANWRYRMTEETEPVRDSIAHWLGYTEKVLGDRMLSPEDLPETGWEAAVPSFEPNSDPFGILPVFPLHLRSIPSILQNRVEFQKVTPSVFVDGSWTVPPHSHQIVCLDAGEIDTGLLNLPVSGGKGSCIRLCYSEAYFHKQNGQTCKKRRDDQSGMIWGREDVFYPQGNQQCYQPFWFRTFRYLQLTVETQDEALTILQPDYRRVGYPLKAETYPQVKEEWLRKIWQMSLRTLQRCMHETYEDCPYYEQMQYTMDTRLQILFTYAVSHDTAMARKTLWDYHSSILPNGALQSRYPCAEPQVIPVFSLHWIFMLWDYYWETADLSTVREYLGTMDRVLHYFRMKKSDGLAANLGYWEMVDWTDAWKDNRGVPHACPGPSTIQNFQYAYALQRAAELAGAIGFHDLASSYRQEAEEICTILDQRCFDPERGLYREGPSLEEYTQHAQVWAVLCGVGDAAFRRALMVRVMTQPLIPCSFPLQFYLFRALEIAGLYEYTEKLWQLWKNLLPQGLTTIPEKPGETRSDCHAWGSLLLYEFPHKMLGVTPAEPGWKKVRIQPLGLFLKQAAGKVALPGGYATVDWHVEDGNFQMKVKCTHRGEVVLPDGQRLELLPDEEQSFACKLRQ